MFVLTQALVAHAVKEWGLSSELAADVQANEQAIKKFLMQGIVDATIDSEVVEKLSEEAAATKEKSGQEVLQDALASANAPVLKSLESLGALLEKAFASTTTTAEPEKETTGKGAEKAPDVVGIGRKVYNAAMNANPAQDVNVRVKGVEEGFSTTKSFVGRQTSRFTIPGSDGAAREFDGFSELDKAVVGATAKYLFNRAAGNNQISLPPQMKMTELDNRLMEYAAHKMAWSGPIGHCGSDDDSAQYGFVENKHLDDFQTKAVLDGATSGGLEAVPIVFDDTAVLTPLLHGELTPFVDMRTTTRRRVESFSVANPDMYWEVEGTTPTEFSTSGFIGEFNTNVHPCVGWMELGLDFQSDSPVNIADIIISRYAEAGANALDTAIATGDGVAEPLGIANTVGATVVNSANGAGGPLTPADYEDLFFAIPKEFRNEARNRFRFISNDVSYSRGRTIAVGTGDARRVYGERRLDNYGESVAGEPYAINHTLGNSTIMAAMLNRYVLYRRLGFDVRRESGGQDLAKKNMELIVVRMRYGGQMNHSSAVAIISDAQS